MRLKLTNILPLVVTILCLLFQHDCVRAQTVNPDSLNRETVAADSIQQTDTIPVPPDTTIDAASLKSQVKYKARDSMVVDIEKELVYLYGGAVVDYEDLHLTADYIKIDFENKEISAQGSVDTTGMLTGKPQFSQGAQEFKSTSMRYNFDTKKGKIAYVVTKEGEGYIHGETVKKDPFNNFYIRNGQYTTCENDTPHFAITARKLKVISNNKIVTGPAYLTIEEIPTPILIPFGFFPSKKGRSSGLIFPAFGESANMGFFFQDLGYYLGLNDHVTFALTSDLYTKGSYKVTLSSLYSNRYRYKGNVNVSYSRTAFSEKELPDFNENRDFQINWSHFQDPKARPNSDFSAQVRAGTGDYYRNNISSVNNFLNNTFQSSINFAQRFSESKYTLDLAASHWQSTLSRDISVTIPEVNFGVSRINPFARKNQIGVQRWYEKIGLYYRLNAKNTIETKDSLLFEKESLDQFKNGIMHSLPLSTSFKLFKYFTLTPSINMTDRMYFKTVRYSYNQQSEQADTIQIRRFANAFDYSFSTSLNTRIYGMFQYKRGPVAAIRHVMSPTMSYSYRPDYGLERYGYYRQVQADSIGTLRTYSIFQNGVYGYPGSGKSGIVSFGLDNNLEMKVRTESDTGSVLKKIKLLESLAIRGNYNLAADSMNLSSFGLSGRTTLFDRVGINFGATLNPYAYDEFDHDYDKYLYDVNGKLFRVTDVTMSANISLAPKSKAAESNKYTAEEMEYIRLHPEEYVDFNIPYNLNISYTFDWSRRGDAAARQTQNISVNGDVSLTPKWKIGFTSWYDFTAERFTNVSVNIFRDLHCWEMRLNWIPFGYQESYFFQINVKSSILQDLKLMKRKTYFDD